MFSFELKCCYALVYVGNQVFPLDVCLVLAIRGMLKLNGVEVLLHLFLLLDQTLKEGPLLGLDVV